MTAAPPAPVHPVHARAAVRAADHAPGRGSEAAPRLRRRGRRSPLTVAHVVAVELVLAGVAIAGRSPVPLAVAALAALLALPLVFWRSGGHWWYQRYLLDRRLRGRSRTTGAAGLLDRLAPDLTIAGARDQYGAPVGIGADGAGWFAVLRLESLAGVRLDRLVGCSADSPVPVASLQLVTHTVPIGADHDAPAVRSYRQLAGDAPVAAHQTVWLAVRVDLADGWLFAEDHGGTDEPHRALATLTTRLTRTLRTMGVTARALAAEELHLALESSLGQDAARHADERWRFLLAGDRAQVTHWVSGWPDRPGGTDLLLSAPAAVPADFTDVALVVRPHGAAADVAALIRVCAAETDLPRALAALRRVTDRAGARLRRLDGEHGPAAFASAPTGGGVLW